MTRRLAPPRPGQTNIRADAPAGRRSHGFAPVEYRQLAVFDLVAVGVEHDLVTVRRNGRLPEPRHAGMAAALDAAILEHAARHGWPRSTITRTRLGARVLQGMQDTPGAVLLASDAGVLNQVHLSPLILIDAACAAGLMLDDRQPAVYDWFATNTAALPTQMRAELSE